MTELWGKQQAPAWRLDPALELHRFHLRVGFEPSALDDLRRAPLDAGVEIGFALVGLLDENLFRVHRCAQADERGSRAHDRVSLDFRRFAALADLHARDGLEILGSAHTHLADRGTAWHSSRDLRSWHGLLLETRTRHHLGCIINRRPGGDWSDPEATAFVLTRTASGTTESTVVPVEFGRMPVRMVALSDEPLYRGAKRWDDDPLVRENPAAWAPVRSDTARANEGARSTLLSKLPGGWKRHTRPAPLGDFVWYERPSASGGIETHYGVPAELVACTGTI